MLWRNKNYEMLVLSFLIVAVLSIAILQRSTIGVSLWLIFYDVWKNLKYSEMIKLVTTFTSSVNCVFVKNGIYMMSFILHEKFSTFPRGDKSRLLCGMFNIVIVISCDYVSWTKFEYFCQLFFLNIVFWRSILLLLSLVVQLLGNWRWWL